MTLKDYLVIVIVKDCLVIVAAVILRDYCESDYKWLFVVMILEIIAAVILKSFYSMRFIRLFPIVI